MQSQDTVVPAMTRFPVSAPRRVDGTCECDIERAVNNQGSVQWSSGNEHWRAARSHALSPKPSGRSNCDGWELRDRPLVVISEGLYTFQLVKVVWNWSHDLLVCTNGHQVFTEEQRETLRKKGIEAVEDPITTLAGKQGQLERIVFANQEERSRAGGFVAPSYPRLRLLAKNSAVRGNATGESSLTQWGERPFQAYMPRVPPL